MFIYDRKLNLKIINQKLKERYLLNLAGTLIVKHRVVFDQYTPCPELDASYSLTRAETAQTMAYSEI